MTRDVLPMACGICGEDEAFTGSCGGGRNKPTALCYTPLEQPVQPEDHLQAISDFGQLQEQEPLARLLIKDGYVSVAAKIQKDGEYQLYAAPPKREWVGLTHGEADTYLAGGMFDSEWEIYKAVEAKLKELNTSPPKRQPLSAEQIDRMWVELCDKHIISNAAMKAIARAIELHHDIGDKT
jgi:hypothetical protein